MLIDHLQNCYFFREGYIRTSSSTYTTDPSALDNEYIHLTNNAIQKNAPNYNQFEEGNQLSFSDFSTYLESHYKKPKSFFNQNILKSMMH